MKLNEGTLQGAFADFVEWKTATHYEFISWNALFQSVLVAIQI